jgi:hypothetical protein
MPSGLWKSEWQLLREDLNRRDQEWREDLRRRDEQREQERREWRVESEARDQEWREWRDASEARADERHRELIATLDENGRNIETALEVMTREIVGMRTEVHECTDSVKSQTEGLFRLIDRFDEFEGRRPPGRPPPLRPV